MEKGYPPQESSPPYPGPPLNYGGPAPQPGMYPQPGLSPSAPPPAGYPGGAPIAPAPAAPASTVTYMVVAPKLQEIPEQVVCPHCQKTVVTKTEHISGLLTYLIFGGLAVVGCFFCCFIPFCVDSCKDVLHTCPSCQNTIYLYKRL